jgi:hypothetical protein
MMNCKRGAQRLPTQRNDKKIEMLISLIESEHAIYMP